MPIFTSQQLHIAEKDSNPDFVADFYLLRFQTMVKQFVRPDFGPKSNIQRIQKKIKAHKLYLPYRLSYYESTCINNSYLLMQILNQSVI